VFLATTDISPVFLRFRLEFETAPIIPSRVPCCVFSLVRIPFLCANANYTNGLSHFRPRRPVLRFSHGRRFFFYVLCVVVFFFDGEILNNIHAHPVFYCLLGSGIGIVSVCQCRLCKRSLTYTHPPTVLDCSRSRRFPVFSVQVLHRGGTFTWKSCMHPDQRPCYSREKVTNTQTFPAVLIKRGCYHSFRQPASSCVFDSFLLKTREDSQVTGSIFSVPSAG
jgi:hypothetical protein